MGSGKGFSLRHLVKTGVARTFHSTRADELMGMLAGSKRMPLVVGYHRVVEDFAAEAQRAMPAMLTSCGMLERHLEWIGRRFRFVSLDELGERVERGGEFDGPVAAVTFDDGYRDVYENAFPLLQGKGIPAAVFVVTDLIGTSRVQIYDRLYLLLEQAFSRRESPRRALGGLLDRLGMRLREIERMMNGAASFSTVTRALLRALPQGEVYRVIEALEAEVELPEAKLKGLLPLTWEMVEEMHQAGMTIGSHTRTHALLANESRERVLDEIAGSRRELERRLGIAIHHLAYPDGRFTAATVRAVAASGYRFAYTTCTHRDPNDPLLTIPRMLLWENSCLDPSGRFSQAIMSCQVHGVFNFLGSCGQDHTA